MTLTKCLILCAVFFYSCESYKILFVSHIPRASHYKLTSKIVFELAQRGHEVTFITPISGKNKVKNVKEINIGSLLDQLPPDNGPSLFDLQTITLLQKAKRIMNFQYIFSKYLLEHEKVQTLFKSKEGFDAVITYHYMNDALVGIAHHFQAPLILFSPMPLYSPESFLLSHPSPPSYVPNILTDYAGNMNFWQRLKNTYHDTSLILYYLWSWLPKHRELVRQNIPGSPDLYDFINNSSLLLINSHVSTNVAIPQVPNAVEIGGYHMDENKPLPPDLQKYLDDSKNGVILFSMGSISKSSEFPKEKRDILIRAFSKLKQNVLWKWEEDNLPGISANVKIMKWIPQSDVLAHPNVKAFISHGGLSSTMESVYHGVPIVGMPVFIDQLMNIALAVTNGYAVQVSYLELTEDKLTSALNEVLTNPKYADNIKKRSLVMRDRPMKPLDSAVYWTEYVIRHGGAPHLRYPGMELTWYQRYLLDVVGFVVLAILALILVISAVLRKLFKKKSKMNRKSKRE